MARKKNTTQINFRINADLKDKLDELARERHTDRTTLIVEAVIDKYDIDRTELRKYVEEE